MIVYKKEKAEQLTILEISAEMGYAVQLNQDGTIQSGQDGAEIPSMEEIEAYRQTAWDAIQARKYKAKRNDNYPSVKDQLDMLWHDIKNGTLDTSGEFYSAIQDVKNTYQKPTGNS